MQKMYNVSQRVFNLFSIRKYKIASTSICPGSMGGREKGRLLLAADR